jgi:hypothetical protein
MAELADRIAFTAGPSGPNKVSSRRHSLLRTTRCEGKLGERSDLRADASPLSPRVNAQEYLYKVCDAVRELSPLSEDNYLKQLEKLVRERDPDSRSSIARGL